MSCIFIFSFLWNRVNKMLMFGGWFAFYIGPEISTSFSLRFFLSVLLAAVPKWKTKYEPPDRFL